MEDQYDPLNPPDPALWLALDEEEQLQLVMVYHHAAGEMLPNLRAHAALHIVVENQVAIGQPIPVAATLVRLQNEGLDRHEAIHAIASVLVGQMNDILATGEPGGDLSPEYYQQLNVLTAAGWRRQFD
jgi:hypothetical protein